MVPDSPLIEWLLENGGPIIRYRTATELLKDNSPVDVERLHSDLLRCPEVQRWMRNLGKGPVHSSKDTAAENAMAKLLEYGLAAGVRSFDEKMLPYCDCGQGGRYHRSALYLVPFLIRAGYWRETAVSEWFMRRLQALHRTAKRREFKVHLDDSQKEGLPKAWIGKPIYRHEFSPAGDEHPLPTCYDFYAMAHFPKRDKKVRQTVEEIADYLSDPRFQAIPGGYIWDRSRRRCHAAGRVYLACLNPERLVLFLELASSFAASRKAGWFRKAVRELERFRTPTGTYRFPREYLKERPNGYCLYAGAHMGLGENRRSKRALETESTFRMLRIKGLVAK